MFTGIVQGVGSVRSVEPRGGDVRMWIDTGDVPLAGVGIGGSIAVNGACLTAVEIEPAAFAADLSRETLSLTTAGEWAPGTPVNLEKALTAGQALGGHYVTGPRGRRGEGGLAARRRAFGARRVRGAGRARALRGPQGLDLRGRREPDRERRCRHAASTSTSCRTRSA